MSTDKKNWNEIIMLFVISVVYVFLFSFTTSPLFPDYAYIGNDSSQFLTIGKAWLYGKIPYRDMFDHKGPFIFFIDFLGFLIVGGRSCVGVFFIQIIFLFFTLIAIYKISQLISVDKKYGISCIVISLILMRNNYVEGNAVEEYCLPFLCWSSFFLLKELYFEKESSDSKWGLITGVTAGVCFLTRITNFMPVTGLIFVVIVSNIIKKNYLDILKVGCMFILGAAITCLPFILYFSAFNVLNEMIYATFTYNIEYALGMKSWLFSANDSPFLRSIFYFFMSFLLVPTSILAWQNKRKSLFIAYVITWLIETYFFVQGQAFPQYVLICVCHVPMFLNELKFNYKREKRTFLYIFLGGIISAAIVANIVLCVKIPVKIKVACSNIKLDWQVLFSEIPQEDKDYIVLYGGNEFKGSYIAFDILPCYKYHIIQEWHAQFSDFVRQDIRNTFETLEAKWIMADGNVENVLDILNENYVVYDTVEGYTLYHKK